LICDKIGGGLLLFAEKNGGRRRRNEGGGGGRSLCHKLNIIDDITNEFN
jgi:hypothetical protein